MVVATPELFMATTGWLASQGASSSLAAGDQVEVLWSNLALQMFVKTPSDCCHTARMFPESSMAIPVGPERSDAGHHVPEVFRVDLDDRLPCCAIVAADIGISSTASLPSSACKGRPPRRCR